MLFATLQKWQETNPVIQAVNAPFNLFNMFELMVHKIFYVLKIEVNAEKGIIVQRVFFIDSYEKVLEVLSCMEVRSHQLEIFVPNRSIGSRKSSIHIVKKIYQPKEKNYLNSFIFECIDETISDLSQDDMARLSKKDLICIYPVEIYSRK